MYLLSAPSGPVAPSASTMHNLTVLTSIPVSQSYGRVCRCLAMVVLYRDRFAVPPHGNFITDRSFSMSQEVLLGDHQYADKVQFALGVNGGSTPDAP